MTDWAGLQSYIKSNYKVAEEGTDSMTLLFKIDEGRSQAILVAKLGEIGGVEWASVSTAVCDESQIDARDALIRNSEMIVGGLALVRGGPVIFRHSFPLGDLEPPEFELPLHVAVQFGDHLERELTGQDRY